MSDVKLLTVSEDEGEQRLDRWFKRRFPQLTQGAVEKMCRTGQVRVDSSRAKASDHVVPGQVIHLREDPSTGCYKAHVTDYSDPELQWIKVQLRSIDHH